MIRYTPADPADWIVLIADRRVLAIDSSRAPRAAELAALLASDDGFAGVLEEVVREGILTAPGFALLDWSTGPLRVVLRGAARMTVIAARGELRASGSGVSTWTEQVVEDARTLRLEIPGGAVDAAPAAPASADRAPAAEVTIVTSELLADPSAADPSATVPSLTGSVPAASPGLGGAPSGARAGRPGDAPGSPTAEPTEDGDPDPDGDRLGATVIRTVAGAAVRLPSGDAARLGDHDGETVLAADLAGLADRVRLADLDPGAAAPEGERSGPVPVPPSSPTFSLVSSTGVVEPLGRGVIIGRGPSVSQVPGGSIPRLVTIADDPDISRNHVRIAIEGDAAIVTDLGSKNGTSVVQPGKPPQRLRGNEPTIVMPGTVLDLGGGAEFTIRQDALEGESG
ncbi:MAG: FHA domain-containing protein [Micrococcales bacterium]|nr:FHA domain-containing protein [Micrococcales bacterium]